MIALPTKGFAKSVTKHNLKLNLFCDWIEASLLFNDLESVLSQIDVVDVLIEEERYTKQDFALEGIKNAWMEIRRRIHCFGKESAIQVNKLRIQRLDNWRSYPAYTFCLLLSLAPYYDWWVEDSYLEQGELFELLSEASFRAQFEYWEVYRTGWARSNAIQLRETANEVAERLGEDLGDLDTWDEPYAKELGLDIVCYKAYPDNWLGIPIYMMQCASGSNWNLKLHTPDLAKWKDIIHFKSYPVKSFSTPFVLTEKEFKRCATAVQGLFLDRCRLLGVESLNRISLSNSLKDRLIGWAESRIDRLLINSR